MADKIVQLKDKDNNNIYPVSAQTPVIHLTDTDPGEGAPLSSNEYVGVYGDMNWIFDAFYPIGSYYETSDETFDPNTAWGGTWVEDTKGRVTVSKADSGTFATVGDTGGAETHALTVNEMPSHDHNVAKSGVQYSNLVLMAAPWNKHGDAGNATGSGNWVWNYGVPPQGGSQAHNNLQPYTVVKRWHRVG